MRLPLTLVGKLYLCAIKDVFANRIVGYAIDSRMKSRIAVNALNNAVARRGVVAGCILHTDRGSQFRSRKHVLALTRHPMVGSMGRHVRVTRGDLRIAIVTWIERTSTAAEGSTPSAD